MAFKMTGVLKCSLQNLLLSSTGSPRKRTVESTSEFKHFMLFQIWHKPTAHLWKMLLTDTNSFRLWKDEKVCTRQCLLHYLLQCITSIIGNTAVVSEEWKTGTQCFKKEQKKCSNLGVLADSTSVWNYRLHLCLQGWVPASRGQNELEEPARMNGGKTSNAYRQLWHKYITGKSFIINFWSCLMQNIHPLVAIHQINTEVSLWALTLTFKSPQALEMVCKCMFLAHWQCNVIWQSWACSDGSTHLRFPFFHLYDHGEKISQSFFNSMASTIPSLWYHFLHEIFRKKYIYIW